MIESLEEGETNRGGTEVTEVPVSDWDYVDDSRFVGGEGMGVGMPAALKLETFGAYVWMAFRHLPYHVGSSVLGKQWRDVDVRLILPDEEYEALGLGRPSSPMSSPKWTALCLAFSVLGREQTGLPIDFQIQQQTKANEDFSGPRSVIGARMIMGLQ